MKAQFDTLTECASDLMANGEYEVYSDTKRVFERDAGMSLSTVSKGVSPVPSSAGYDERVLAASTAPSRSHREQRWLTDFNEC